MKVNFINTCSIILLAGVLITGCKKAHPVKRSLCRLERWQGLDDGYLRRLEYNDEGLVWKWHESAPLYNENLLFTFKYDKNGRIASMKFFDQDSLINFVVPLYKGGRIMKELWYLGDETTIDDTVVNTYGANERIVKRESINYEYSAIFTYDAFGNVIRQSLRGTTDGFLYDSVVQAFDKTVKEPMVAVPGLPYPMVFSNYIVSRNKYIYFKEINDDGTGNLVTSYELDPDKSMLTACDDHYAIYHNTFDKVSGVYNRQIWRYEICDCNDDNLPPDDNATNLVTSPVKSKRLSPFITMKEMRDKVGARKAQLLNKAGK